MESSERHKYFSIRTSRPMRVCCIMARARDMLLPTITRTVGRVWSAPNDITRRYRPSPTLQSTRASRRRRCSYRITAPQRSVTLSSASTSIVPRLSISDSAEKMKTSAWAGWLPHQYIKAAAEGADWVAEAPQYRLMPLTTLAPVGRLIRRRRPPLSGHVGLGCPAAPVEAFDPISLVAANRNAPVLCGHHRELRQFRTDNVARRWSRPGRKREREDFNGRRLMRRKLPSARNRALNSFWRRRHPPADDTGSKSQIRRRRSFSFGLTDSPLRQTRWAALNSERPAGRSPKRLWHISVAVEFMAHLFTALAPSAPISPTIMSAVQAGRLLLSSCVSDGSAGQLIILRRDVKPILSSTHAHRSHAIHLPIKFAILSRVQDSSV